MNRSVWFPEWIRLGLALLAALALGYYLDHPWPALGGALGLLLAWHLFQALRLLVWLDRRRPEPPPNFPKGLWHELAQRFRQLNMRNRKRKQTLSRFYKRFREVAKAFPDAILILGKSGEVEWCNPGTRELLGLRRRDVAGRNLMDTLNAPLVAAYLRRGEFADPVEFPSPVNQAMILSMQVTRFGKKSYQRLVVVRDITPVHQLNRSRKDFIANISHELRTPLTVIHGYLEGLEEEVEEGDGGCGQWRRPLHLMHQQTWRMQNVVNDLLTLSKIEMDPTEPPQQAVNVPRMVRELMDDARTLARDSGHRLFADVDAALWLKGSQEELRSAFSNLVYNAVRHTPPGTEIRIHWHRTRNGVQFSVADNGEGIDEEHIPRLTERFYRVDKARSRETGGTGLGLAIVKQIITRYDGRLGVNSVPGKGSTFTCHFPESLAMQADRIG